MSEQTDATPQSESPVRTTYILAGLLVMIALILAGLWMTERGNRLRAERALTEQRRQVEATFASMLRGGMPVSLDRGELATQTRTVDGRPTTVLLMSAAQAELIGLQPGDMVLVTPPAASQSAD